MKIPQISVFSPAEHDVGVKKNLKNCEKPLSMKFWHQFEKIITPITLAQN